MKCIFLKLKYNISLISYIHYLHLDTFKSYNMPTIACNKVLTCDCFVCSLKELISITGFWSSAEVLSLCNLSVVFFLYSVPVPSRVYHLHLKRFLFVFGTFGQFCQWFFFIRTLNITFLRTRLYWGCICDLMCRPTLFIHWYFPVI